MNELSIRNNFLATPTDAAMLEEMEQQMQGVQMSFPRAKVSPGGVTVFTIGDDETAKTLTGVIVEQHPVNVYWASKDIVEGALPDCYSNDGVTGTNTTECKGPSGYCKTCPLNQFGSAEGGRGKACSNKVRLYIMLDGQSIPTQLDIPASSLKTFNEYMSWLRQHMMLPSGVVTEISLVKRQMGTNNVAVCVFKAVGQLAPEARTEAIKYSQSMRRMTRGGFTEINDANDPFDN